MNQPPPSINRSPDFFIPDGSFEIPVWQTEVPQDAPGLTPDAPTRTVTLPNGLVQNALHWQEFANGAARAAAQYLGERWTLFSYDDPPSYTQAAHTATLVEVNELASRQTDQPTVTQIGLSRGCKSAVEAHTERPETVDYSYCMGLAGCSSLNISRMSQEVLVQAGRGINEAVTTGLSLVASRENILGGVALISRIVKSGWRHAKGSLADVIGEIHEITELEEDFLKRMVALEIQTRAVGVHLFGWDRLCPAQRVRANLQASGFAGQIHLLERASHGSVLVSRHHTVEVVKSVPRLSTLRAAA